MMRGVLFGLALALSLGGVTTGCSKKPADPRAEIEQLIGEVEVAVESSDIGAIKEKLADSYSDPKGNDKAGLVAMLQFRFLRKRAIHVFSQIDDITVEVDGRTARATVMAAGGSTPIDGLEALGQVRADIIRLTISFARPDDEWQVTSASWKRASAGDFLGD